MPKARELALIYCPGSIFRLHQSIVRSSFMRWLGLVFLLLLAACSTTREITITAKPPDAVIAVDNGAQKGTGQLTATIKFKNSDDVHTVTATRRGYQDKT